MLFDNHCHFEKLTEVEQMIANRDHRVIGVASDLASSQALLSLATQYSNLSICLGIHPEEITHYHEFEQVVELIRTHRDNIVGIGEIGLPYFCLEQQVDPVLIFKQGLALFEQFIVLADELSLPVNLHCVGDDTKLAIECLAKYQIKRALFHWFAGSEKLVKQIHEQGWYISVSPDVLYNPAYQQVIEHIPKQMMCLESDGPWPYNGNRGQPYMINDVAYFLAKLYQCEVAEIIAISQANSHKLWQQ